MEIICLLWELWEQILSFKGRHSFLLKWTPFQKGQNQFGTVPSPESVSFLEMTAFSLRFLFFFFVDYTTTLCSYQP